MKIRYTSVYSLLSCKFKIQTRQQIIDSYKEQLPSSMVTAELLEDYEYLSIMTGENSQRFDDFVVVYSDHSNLPIVLEAGKSLNLYAFAKLFFTTKNVLKITEFYQVIEQDAIEQSMDPTSLMTQFDIYLAQIEKDVKNSEKKIQRNDPCPCGSGSKFKNCHGALA